MISLKDEQGHIITFSKIKIYFTESEMHLKCRIWCFNMHMIVQPITLGRNLVFLSLMTFFICGLVLWHWSMGTFTQIFGAPPLHGSLLLAFLTQRDHLSLFCLPCIIYIKCFQAERLRGRVVEHTFLVFLHWVLCCLLYNTWKHCIVRLCII